MIYITTNVDELYFNKRRGNWIESVSKNKGDNLCKLFYITDNSPPLLDIDTLKIKSEYTKYSKHPSLKNRPTYVCLESGEFTESCDFNDDDIIILCDWDVTMQRCMSQEEIDILTNLDDCSFAMNRDHYPQSYLYNYLNFGNIFNDINPNWIIYNAGVQSGKFSAWKKLFNYWKIYYNAFFKCEHHATGQGLFNYIIQKHMNIVEMPITYHNAHWFKGTAAKVKDNYLTVENEKVLFNHHKFQYLPSF